MDRRAFIAFVGGSILVSSLAVEAQRRDQIPRVGYLSPGSPSDPVRLRRFEAFRQGLRELGYVEGQNIAIDARYLARLIHRSRPPWTFVISEIME